MDEFWAKLREEEGEIAEWQPLLAHCADVAAVAEAILDRSILRLRLARLAGWTDLDSVQRARMCVLVAIHDAGKANHAFQNRAHSGARPTGGHVGPIVEVLSTDEPMRILEPLGIGEMADWFPDEMVLCRFLLASWGHHGRPVLPGTSAFRPAWWRPDARRDPLAELARMTDAIRRWFPAAFDSSAETFPDSPEFQHAFNGLVTLADWMGSDERFFTYAGEGGNFIVAARRAAATLVEELSFDAAAPRRELVDGPRGFARFTAFEPYEIQRECLELPVHAAGSLTVLESDTGSGKTEAALARFLRLYEAGLVDGMYFALPTRSAATQLHERVRQAVKRAFPDPQRRPPVVQAVPGYVKLDDISGTPLGPFRVQWPDDREEWLNGRAWASEHPKRYLAGAIVVGTVDQVLLSVLQVRHAHMRATALLRHFLVVDEVHASDTYMTQLMEDVLQLHLAAGGHALLMSATLGTAARIRLTLGQRGVVPSWEEAMAERYPLITHVDASDRATTSVHAESSGRTKEVAVDALPLAGSPEEIARLAIGAAREGARVLVIRNRVVDCMETQEWLEASAGQDRDLLFGVSGSPAPHHSRFAREDRRRLDARIERSFGKGVEVGGVVCVATQTVEQSLDIDADLLLTDLCPIDVLLQRIGRLHRHSRDRPSGFGQARCQVLVSESRDLGRAITSDGRGLEGAHGLGTVYDDLRSIEATWRLVESEESIWSVPRDNRCLVEHGTHPERLREIVDEQGPPWDKHQEHVLGADSADRFLAGYVTVDRTRAFGDEGFARDLEQVKTRLGTQDYQVELPEERPGPFGGSVATFTVASWQLDEAVDEVDVEDVAVTDGTLRFRIGATWLRYDRLGLRNDSATPGLSEGNT